MPEDTHDQATLLNDCRQLVALTGTIYTSAERLQIAQRDHDQLEVRRVEMEGRLGTRPRSMWW
jgi:hypothetical protein